MLESAILSFRSDLNVANPPDGDIVLQWAAKRLTLKQISDGLRAAINTLSGTGAPIYTLTKQVRQHDGETTLPKLFYYLDRFIASGFICHTVQSEGHTLATILPLVTAYPFRPQNVAVTTSYTLSRFAYCRRDQNSWVLESPLSHAKVYLHDGRTAALIAALASPQWPADLPTLVPGLTAEAIHTCLSLLLSIRMLSSITTTGADQEAENPDLVQWDFHDLLFHARRRQGRHGNPYGGTYRFMGHIEPLPAVKPRLSEDLIALYKPDLETFKATDPSLTQVLEARQSIRQFGARPITGRQLGEFLYRTARVKDLIDTDYGQLSQRPYPGGGALYELELYLTINACDTIAPGLYHYRPVEHELEKLSDPNSHTKALLKDARQASGCDDDPQVLITFAPRFQRVTWKYESMAYATILKNTGVLYHAMYLVATAMGLAACALGGGHADRFVAAAGTTYEAESSVGEFMLGSKPDEA